MNPIYLADFYKTGHPRQYPDGTEYVYSTLTARNGRHELTNIPNTVSKLDGVVVFGIQDTVKKLQKLWDREFFSQDIDRMMAEYEHFMTNTLGPNVVSTRYLRELHAIGYLPITIKSVPEGSLIPFGMPFMTIRNTHTECYWLTNFLEDWLSAELWKVIRTATIADKWKELFEIYAEQSSDIPEFTDWQGHDFSMRGMSGVEDSTKCGVAHLTSFSGTDVMGAVRFVKDNYPFDGYEGGSVPATEHSVMCMGKKESEIATYERLITELYPTGVVSVVSDTWDYWNVLTDILPKLKDKILVRDGKLVIRPDSGNPEAIICGTVDIYNVTKDETVEYWERRLEDTASNEVQCDTAHGEHGASSYDYLLQEEDGSYVKVTVNFFWNRYDKQYYYLDGTDVVTKRGYVPTPEELGTISLLDNLFGSTINSKGYKQLDSHIGCIYGDAITMKVADRILKRLMRKGFASTNIVFGIGSYSYNFCTRDNLSIAMKATWGRVNGVDQEIFKDPATDPGKKSAKGLIQLQLDKWGNLVMKDQCTPGQEQDSLLQPRMEYGKVTISQSTFAMIKSRIKTNRDNRVKKELLVYGIN